MDGLRRLPQGILDGTLNNCIYIEEFEMVGKYLGVL